MKTNPYQKLKQDACNWIAKVICRRTIHMFTYPKDKIQNVNWNLSELRERVIAAQQLGFEVKISWVDEGLRVDYVEKIPLTPYWYN